MTGSLPFESHARGVASIFPRYDEKGDRGKRKAESGKRKEERGKRKLRKAFSVTKHGFVF